METIRSRTPNAWSTNILQNNQRSTNPLQNNQSIKDTEIALDAESSDDNSSEEGGSKLIDQNLGEGIFKEYLSIHGNISDEAGLSKIRNLLAASKCGAVSCLICLEKVRSFDPVWNC